MTRAFRLAFGQRQAAHLFKPFSSTALLALALHFVSAYRCLSIAQSTIRGG